MLLENYNHKIFAQYYVTRNKRSLFNFPRFGRIIFKCGNFHTYNFCCKYFKVIKITLKYLQQSSFIPTGRLVVSSLGHTPCTQCYKIRPAHIYWITTIFKNNVDRPTCHNTIAYIKFENIKGVLHPWALFLKTLCIFSKKKATSDKVSYRSGEKCSKELKNQSFTSVKTIVVKLQWKMCKNQYFPCFEP